MNQQGCMDVLVDNAGIEGVNAPSDQLPLEEWNRVVSPTRR